MTHPISKELWFSFRFYLFPSCTACRMEHMTLAKPNMHSNALAAYKNWLIRWSWELSQSSQCDSQEFCWEYWDKTLFPDGCERGAYSTGNCWQASWNLRGGGAMTGIVKLQTKQNWAVVTSLSSWISPCQTPGTLFSTFVFSSLNFP